MAPKAKPQQPLCSSLLRYGVGLRMRLSGTQLGMEPTGAIGIYIILYYYYYYYYYIYILEEDGRRRPERPKQAKLKKSKNAKIEKYRKK